jgi:thiol-disulfide isomerase/thioredoxin
MKPPEIATVIAILGLAAALSFGSEGEIELMDIHGQAHKPLSDSSKKGTVLVFVSPFCPTSNALTPEANRIAREHADRFAFYFVEADAVISEADARKHAEKLQISAPLLLDPKQVLAKMTQAKTTPEAVVLGPSGEILYQGRINDLYTTQTRKLKEPSRHDLQMALDAIAAGGKAETPFPGAVGCSITIAR